MAFTHSLISASVACLIATQLQAYADEIAPHSVIGTNHLQPIEQVIGSELYEPSRAVARMEVGAGYCTGFRVAADLFLTNHHCMDFKPCQELQFHLGYETSLPAAKHLFFRCKKIEASSLNLDFALYRVERVASPAIDDYPILALASTLPPDRSPAFLPSHPAVGIKQIDQSSECQLVASTPFSFQKRINISHSCDTMSGSSGGPLLDRSTMRVVGIHWGGVSRDSPYRYNHAIPMPNVLEFIEREAPVAFSQLLIE